MSRLTLDTRAAAARVTGLRRESELRGEWKARRVRTIITDEALRAEDVAAVRKFGPRVVVG